MEQKEYTGFIPASISLDEMMQEREWRANMSNELIRTSKMTTVCMTMNLIGEFKQLPLSHAAFCCFVRLVKSALSCDHYEIYHKNTGDVAFFTSPILPENAKLISEKIESFGTVGRLFDIDVFDIDGNKLSRTQKRKCLICDRSAADCSRSRAHGIESVRAKTINILCDYFSSDITALALQALIDEVDTTPKPGLVDKKNSGANPDMSYEMFINSANTISPYMGKLFVQGALCTSLSDKMFLHNIKELGIAAEAAMRQTTGGINTHKGAIYSIGLLSAGIGYALAGCGSLTDAVSAASIIASELSREIVDANTHGIKVCEKYGVRGARGEAQDGFKTSLYAFERIKHYADDLRLDTNTTYPLAICDIMAIMIDTNVLHRGGVDALTYMHKEAKEISEMRENQRIDDLVELDDEFIKRNISPGGCADVLACALFLIKSEQLFDYNV